MKFIKYIAAASILAALLTGCTGSPGAGKVGEVPKNEDAKVTIVTTFYPVYLHTINITAGVPGVRVVNMTGALTGCLEDYQLTTRDMKTIEKAGILVVNGAGMESFLGKLEEQLPDLKVVNASKGLELLKGEDESEGNPHIWVSISGAIQQVENIAEQLSELDVGNRDSYLKNARNYTGRLEELKAEMHRELDALPSRNIVTFHEAFPYFAKEFNLNIVGVIDQDPESDPGAKELVKTVEAIRKSGVKALFTEPRSSTRAANTLARETGAMIYSLDPVVTGEANGDTDAYINAMKNNMKVLKEALK